MDKSMIKSAQNYPVKEILSPRNSYVSYVIPKYQRGYVWGKKEWQEFFDDINNNEVGYFLGSIICINKSNDSLERTKLEIIDGQQRLTTICLLLAAIINQLQTVCKNELTKEFINEFNELKRILVPEGNMILKLQATDSNNSDFEAVMNEIDFISSDDKNANWGNRKIAKCYRYFISRIEKEFNDDDPFDFLCNLKEKVLKSILVKIEVENYTNGYTLFSTLNNRGTPLTPIDLIKNLILSKSDSNQGDYYQKWEKLLSQLSNDHQIQERFFRHYYNAFQNELTKGNKKMPSVATRSNYFGIYEELIKTRFGDLMTDMFNCGNLYSMIIAQSDSKYKKQFLELSRIQGSPSYLLILFLLKKQKDLKITDRTFQNIVSYLTVFFVRRNLTDKPSTRDLNNIFIQLLKEIKDEKLTGSKILQRIKCYLKSKSATDKEFEESLRGDIYVENRTVTRFLLCALANKFTTKEKIWVDLWAKEEVKNKLQPIWTIEHIFPEGQNIPSEWVRMIANNDESKAKEIQKQFVHKLGNLTITGYNSGLGNAPFEKKLYYEKNGKQLGYKNGLGLNSYIVRQKSWTVDKISRRTNILVKELMEMYKLK